MRLYPFLRTAKAQLILWNVLVLALLLLVLGGVLRLTVEHNSLASIDENITSRARGSQHFWGRIFMNGAGGRGMYAAPSTPNFSNGNRRGDPRFMSPPVERPPSQWQARMEEKSLDLEGRRFFTSIKDSPIDAATFERAALGEKVYSIVTIDRVRVRVVSAPLRRGGDIVGIVQVGYALDGVDRAVSNLDRTLLTLIPVGLLAAGVSGLFLTRRMLRPVREVTQAASRIGAEDLSRRLPVNGSDEFSSLAATFNDMLARLDRAFEQQRRFAADASHELRTPLTVIKANTSLALGRTDLAPNQRKVLQSIDNAAGVMNHIVQDMLLLARSDAGQLELQLRPTCLVDVLEKALACIPPQPGATIRNLGEESELIVLADPNHLTRLFVNLLDNAVRHTPPDGCITLSAHAEEDKAIVMVEDTGCGIPAEHLPHICDRFYRADEARSSEKGGSGLGLAICQSIITAHKGSLEVTSAIGIGTKVTVTLSVAASLDQLPSCAAEN